VHQTAHHAPITDIDRLGERGFACPLQFVDFDVVVLTIYEEVRSNCGEVLDEAGREREEFAGQGRIRSSVV